MRESDNAMRVHPSTYKNVMFHDMSKHDFLGIIQLEMKKGTFPAYSQEKQINITQDTALETS